MYLMIFMMIQAWEPHPWDIAKLRIEWIIVSGETYESKMARVRQKMVERHADLFVVSKLDEIAWLLNLRGYEGEHTPTFVAYVTIGNSSASLYTNTSKIPPDVKAHLNKRGAEVKWVDYNRTFPNRPTIASTISF